MLRFFNFPKVKKREFGYQPRFYDPEQEERERRLKRAKLKGNSDAELVKARIGDEFKSWRGRGSRHKKSLLQSSNFRLILVLVTLICITYLVIYRFLPDFLNYLFQEPI